MAPRTRHRPRRGGGDSDPLVTGDSGTYAGQQGGELPGPYETGDLESREFGVPQADIPGGKQHIVNMPTHHGQPGPDAVNIRPADLHKFHGVEPPDLGGYVTPPDATEDTEAQRPEPEPELNDAVPVYIVENAGRRRVIRDCATNVISCPAAGSAPARVCSADPSRVAIHLFNEAATGGNNIRIAPSLEELVGVTSTFQGSGALLPPGAGYLKLETQGDLFAISEASTATLLSVVIETEVNA
jgi:hypothetical protein